MLRSLISHTHVVHVDLVAGKALGIPVQNYKGNTLFLQKPERLSTSMADDHAAAVGHDHHLEIVAFFGHILIGVADDDGHGLTNQLIFDASDHAAKDGVADIQNQDTDEVSPVLAHTTRQQVGTVVKLPGDFDDL